MPEESRDHVVLEMAEISPSNDGAKDISSENPPDDAEPQATPLGDIWKETDVQDREKHDREFDEQMLRRAIADTGRWAYGTVRYCRMSIGRFCIDPYGMCSLFYSFYLHFIKDIRRSLDIERPRNPSQTSKGILVRS